MSSEETLQEAYDELNSKLKSILLNQKNGLIELPNQNFPISKFINDRFISYSRYEATKSNTSIFDVDETRIREFINKGGYHIKSQLPSTSFIDNIELVPIHELIDAHTNCQQYFNKKKRYVEIQKKLAESGGDNHLAELIAQFDHAEFYLNRINKEIERRKLMGKTEIKNDNSQHITVHGNVEGGINQSRDDNNSISNPINLYTTKPESNTLFTIVKWVGSIFAAVIAGYILHRMGWV